MSRSAVSGHFIDGTKGPVFVLARTPASEPSGCVLVVPAFAEEMNKCRRMVTEAALDLAYRGYATVVPDLYGTGDSGGDFSDATWTGWLHDLGRTADWSSDRGTPVTGVLAIRLGAAMAADALATGRVAPVARTVLWQPVFDGNRHLTQFLRLRIAASLAADQKETLVDLRAQIARGDTLEVAGYAVAARLAADIDGIRAPDAMPAGFGETAWIEVVREQGADVPAPSRALIERSAQDGRAVRALPIAGEPFWASTEIVTIPDVVQATVRHFVDAIPSSGGADG